MRASHKEHSDGSIRTRTHHLPPPDARAGVLVREGDYGERVMTVEPGGAEFIPLHERHGRPLQLFWTWTSPNLEFATVFVGVLGVAAFGLSFWQAVLAILVGTAGGALAQGVLSARGPSHGVPQMVLSRLGFGYWGNVLPAGLNSVTAGIGWFAVNSVSGTFALNTLSALAQDPLPDHHRRAPDRDRLLRPQPGARLRAVRLPGARGDLRDRDHGILAKSHPGAAHHAIPGAFLLTTGAVFGYAAGWNPYAADYSRYFPPNTSKAAVGWWSAAGVFISCVVLEIAGAGVGHRRQRRRLARRPHRHVHRPPAHRDGRPHPAGHRARRGLRERAQHLLGRDVLRRHRIKLPLSLRRAIVALVFGLIGFVVAITGLHDAGARYTNFLLIIAYWIAPWLAVVFCDQFLRRRSLPQDREAAVQQAVHQLGRAGRDAHRGGRVGLAVLQPDRVRRRRSHPLPVGG